MIDKECGNSSRLAHADNTAILNNTVLSYLHQKEIDTDKSLKQLMEFSLEKSPSKLKTNDIKSFNISANNSITQ